MDGVKYGGYSEDWKLGVEIPSQFQFQLPEEVVSDGDDFESDSVELCK